MSKDVVEITKEQEARTDGPLWNGSRILLEKSQKNEEGSFYLIMASIIFSAFSLEAYLNHVGWLIYKPDEWKKFERKSPLDKVDKLNQDFNIPFNRGSRPYQTIKSIFTFRDQLAHGKTKILNSTETVAADKYSDTQVEQLKTKWEKYCTEENAIQAREDVKKLAETIGDRLRIVDPDESHNYYPLIYGTGIHVASLKSR